MTGHGRYSIESDDRTTWVHLEGRLVGRICPVSAEVVGEENERGNVCFFGPPTRTFGRFAQLILERFGIKVPIAARPTITTMNRKAMHEVACGEVLE
jgi:hypothetical protein